MLTKKSREDLFLLWIFVYHIFSIYTIDSETYYIKTNFSGYKERLEWINNMKERNTSGVDVDVTSTDKVITLSTCLNDFIFAPLFNVFFIFFCFLKFFCIKPLTN